MNSDTKKEIKWKGTFIEVRLQIKIIAMRIINEDGNAESL